MDKKLIIAIVLIVVPIFAFYFIPLYSMIYEPKISELTSHYEFTFSKYLELCNSDPLSKSLVESIYVRCGVIQFFQYIVWVCCGVGGFLIYKQIRSRGVFIMLK